MCLTPRDLADVIPVRFKISNGSAQRAYGRNKVYCEKSAEAIVGIYTEGPNDVLSESLFNNQNGIPKARIA